VLNYRSVEDLNKCIVTNLHRIPNGTGLVVGIPRDGMIVGGLIAAYLNLPLTDLNSFIENRAFTDPAYTFGKINNNQDKILIVDDFINFGTTIKSVKEKLTSSGIDASNITFLSVYAASKKKAENVDMYFEVVPMHRMLEWNVVHHPFLRYACVDIDGVLCRNPSAAEDDDGEKYLKFIRDVAPYINPGYPIATLITCRLEKYREETEKWLKKNNIKYKNIIMMDLPSKEARAKVSRSDYKAEAFNKTEAMLFIESSVKQAREIAQKTGKSVFCTSDHRFYNAGGA
jgi:uncharacterized HAD superfamily protein